MNLSPSTTHIGDISITSVTDGTVSFAATTMFPTTTEADWVNHAQFVDNEGNLNLDVGSYVVRSGSRTVLIDAGVGDIQRGNINGGQLLGNLAAMGVTPADIETVVFTHMHFDHMGWASTKVDATYQATFPNASYRAHQHELDYHYSTVNPMHERFAAMATGFESRIETFEDGEEIAPGVTMVLAAGHTPGSSLVVLASRGQRGILLGDTMHCPAQVQHPDWGPLFDVDPVAAQQIRETLVRETAGDTLVGAAHFPNLSFGRLVSSGTARIWSAVRPTPVL